MTHTVLVGVTILAIFKEIWLNGRHDIVLRMGTDGAVEDTARVLPTINEQCTGVDTDTTLETLFDSVHKPMENAHEVCQVIRPFAVIATARYPTSTTAREILHFIDEGVSTGTASSSDSAGRDWSCTTGQMNAIVHFLNGNQYLLEREVNPDTIVQTPIKAPTGYTAPTEAEIDADDAFMKELSDLAM
jgi:hypothetical protein